MPLSTPISKADKRDAGDAVQKALKAAADVTQMDSRQAEEALRTFLQTHGRESDEIDTQCQTVRSDPNRYRDWHNLHDQRKRLIGAFANAILTEPIPFVPLVRPPTVSVPPQQRVVDVDPSYLKDHQYFDEMLKKNIDPFLGMDEEDLDDCIGELYGILADASPDEFDEELKYGYGCTREHLVYWLKKKYLDTTSYGEDLYNNLLDLPRSEPNE